MVRYRKLVSLQVKVAKPVYYVPTGKNPKDSQPNSLNHNVSLTVI